MLSQSDIAPYGAVPTANQMEWHRMQFYAFVHFGPNTFSGEEWGTGREDPSIFNPTKLDCRQWVKAFKGAGMTGVIITAKHHDGFCLWPSKFSDHTVARSPWKSGKGDVLAELAKACKAEGLKMGVYLSPWDRNHPAYGTPEYNQVFANMLEEVLTNYGEIFEVWFDGANGEGPNGKRQVYDWDLFISVVRMHQPRAVVFGDAFDVRWVGNERGIGSETNWATLDKSRFLPGGPHQAELGEGKQGGRDYSPAEADVSIRPGWFWRESEYDKVKRPVELLDIYLASVGRGCNLLLNVPPNKDGLISQQDIDSLTGFQSLLRAYLTDNIARRAEVIASSTRDGLAGANLIDNLYETIWSPEDGVNFASVLLRFDSGQEISAVELQEYMPAGQRVRKFMVEAETSGKWVKLAEGTTIGYRRILPVGPTHTRKIRVTIVDTVSSPVLSSIAVYSSRSML